MHIAELMNTARWLDPPKFGETPYERFFIRDRETHEWFMGMTRETFANFVTGKTPFSAWNTKYEPLRDEVHHLVVSTEETIFDSVVVNDTETEINIK